MSMNMKILGGSKEKSTVYIAVLTLAVMGLGLVFSTWQILRKQREASMEHLELTAMAVLQAVDSSLRRGSFMGRNRFATDTRDFFRDLENSGDILFVGIIDETGMPLVVEGENRARPLVFPEGALQGLRSGNRWLGAAQYGGKPVYVAARRIQTAPSGMRRPGMGHRHRDEIPSAPETPVLFLLVAMDMDKHFAVYQGFRRTAIFQAMYILAAAVFLWALAAHFISRRKLLEKNLAEAEKLAAIGSLAAGVAHEIRNPLSALRGFAQYFAKKLAGRQPEEEYARTMVRESDRLNRVITDLLYLARPRDLSPARVDLPALYGELAALLQFELCEQGMALVCHLEAPEATADPDALKQALLNLLLNAMEAMASERDGGGGAREAALSSERGSWRGNGGVWISVTDTGPGMSAENRTRAFTPFFSTKKKGTGLGLALVQTIMRGHGGEAAIESPVPGAVRGCRVRLFFPDAIGTGASGA